MKTVSFSPVSRESLVYLTGTSGASVQTRFSLSALTRFRDPATYMSISGILASGRSGMGCLGMPRFM